MKNKFIFLFIGIFLISFVSANLQVGISDDSNGIGINLIPEFDLNTTTVNSSKFWYTDDRGPLNRVDQIEHNWLDAASLLWSNAGHIMDFILDMNNYDIVDVKNVNSTGTINVVSSEQNQIVVKNTNPFAVASIDILNSEDSRVSFAKLGPKIPQVITNGYEFGGNASGLVSFATDDGHNMVFLTGGNNSIIFGNMPDGNTQNATFGMAYDPVEQGLTFFGNKLIRPVEVDGGFGLLFENRDNLTAGGFPFIFISNTSGGETIVTSWQTVGRNNSFSGQMNSFGTVPKSWVNFTGMGDEEGIDFLFNASDYINYCNYF